MTLILPRLQSSLSIVDENGRPTVQFMQWWQTVTQALEVANTDIETVNEQQQAAIEAIEAAQAAAAAANEAAEAAQAAATDAGEAAVAAQAVANDATVWDPLESTCRHASLSIL